MSQQVRSGRGSRATAVLLLAAIAAAAALVMAALLLDVVSQETVTVSEGAEIAITRSSATLVDQEGARVLLVVSIPLVVALVVAVALGRRRRAGIDGAGPVALVVTGLLGLFVLLSLLSIGVFVLPVFVLLLAACASAGAPAR